jgi:hypothetical protein
MIHGPLNVKIVDDVGLQVTNSHNLNYFSWLCMTEDIKYHVAEEKRKEYGRMENIYKIRGCRNG